MNSLTESETYSIIGGSGITTDTSVAYDLFNLFGVVAGALYGLMTGPTAASGNWHSGMLGYSPNALK